MDTRESLVAQHYAIDDDGALHLVAAAALRVAVIMTKAAMVVLDRALGRR